MSAVGTWRELPGGETEFMLAFAFPERSSGRRVDASIRFSIEAAMGMILPAVLGNDSPPRRARSK